MINYMLLAVIMNSNIEIKYTVCKLYHLEQTLLKSVEAIDGAYNPRYYYETLWDCMGWKSNIKEVFESQGLSKRVFRTNISNILRSIKDSSPEDILDNFLQELNNLYLKYKEMDDEKINIIMYTNIPKKFKDNDKFKDTLKYFNLTIFDYSEYNFENDESLDDDIKNKFNNGSFLMLKYSNKGKDYEFIKNVALNTIYSFFGYVTYIHKFRISTEKFHINEITLDNKVTDLEINALIATDSNNKIFDIISQQDVIDTAIKLGKSKIIKFDNQMGLFHTLLDDVCEVDNDVLFNQLMEYFSLYYIASQESTIENSFMKFWSLSERIIKNIHVDIKDKKLVKYMEKLLLMFNYPEKIIQRLKFIKHKRNILVHENIHGEITQSDQSIVKILSENLIGFLINYYGEVNNLQDYARFYVI